MILKRIRKLSLVLAISIAILAPSTSIAGRHGGAGRLPNIILIMLEDVGGDIAVAFDAPANRGLTIPFPAPTLTHPYAIQPAETPVIEGLISSGINYTGLWGGPFCHDSRSMIVSGATHEISWAGSIYYQGVNPPLDFNELFALMETEGLGHRLKSTESGYHILEGGKCLFFTEHADNIGDGTGTFSHRDVLVNVAGGTAGTVLPSHGCGMFGSGLEAQPRHEMSWLSASGGGTLAASATTIPNEPRVWSPAGFPNQGFLPTPELSAYSLAAALEAEVMSGVNHLNNQPFILGWNMPGGHSPDFITSGVYDTSGHPIPAILADARNANPETPGFEFRWDQIGGPNFLAGSFPIACDGFTQAETLAESTGSPIGWGTRKLFDIKSVCIQRMVNSWDRSIGILLDYIGAAGLENTYVILTGDNSSDSITIPNFSNPNVSGIQMEMSLDPTFVLAGATMTNAELAGLAVYRIPANSINNQSGADIVVDVGDGKGDAGTERSMQVPLVISHGHLPRASRGQTSLARLWMSDVGATLRKMTMPNVDLPYDGVSIASTWESGCTDYSDFLSPCHSVRGYNLAARQVRGAPIQTTSGWTTFPAPQILLCPMSSVSADPDSAGRVYRLERSECRPDYLQDLNAADPLPNLRNDPAHAAAYATMVALLNANQVPLMGQNAEGPCDPLDSGC